MTRMRQSGFEYDVSTAVVTGATGTVGSWTVDRLANRGVQVVGVDVERPSKVRANATFRAVDLTDRGATWETLQEVAPDVVVHLAAISDPLTNPDSRVFENNVTSAYNVLAGAARAGTDVVWTSSQASYGALFAESSWTPDYLPIDETHARRPEDAYGLSKVCSEEIARTVARRYDVSVTTLRPATVFSPNHTRARPSRDGTDLSEDERAGDLGSYVDVRDVARMVEAVIGADAEGYEEFLCVADENYLGRPTVELVEAICGGLPEECSLEGNQAALSNAKARDMLGWEPEHSWLGDEPDAASGPTWL